MKILILEGIHGNNKGKKCQWRLKRTNLKVGDTVVLDCHDWKIIKVIGEKKRNVFPKGAVFGEYSNLGLPYKIPEYLKGLLNKNGNRFILVGNKRVGKNSFYFAFKNMLKKEQMVTENEFNQKMLGISWDLGIDDYGCMVGYRVDIDGNIKIDDIKYLKKKEVKKVKPYFEMKVVKVKKEKGCNHVGRAYPFSKTGDTVECVDCGEKFILGQEEPKPKGNWINGENLDAIKFPCFCSYIERVTGEKRYAKIDKSWDDIAYKDVYQMSKTTNQSDGISVLYEDVSLKKLMINLKIKILKGKIIIYEEE